MCEVKKTYEDRIKTAVKWWNSRAETIIRPDINGAADQDKVAFKWNQLVWQEILMFIKIGRVGDGEIEWLVHRRGFNAIQEKFLRDILAHVGLLQ